MCEFSYLFFFFPELFGYSGFLSIQYEFQNHVVNFHNEVSWNSDTNYVESVDRSTYVISAGCFVGWSFWGIIVGLPVSSLSHIYSFICIFFPFTQEFLQGKKWVFRVVLQGNQTTLDKIIPAPFLCWNMLAKRGDRLLCAL